MDIYIVFHSCSKLTNTGLPNSPNIDLYKLLQTISNRVKKSSDDFRCILQHLFNASFSIVMGQFKSQVFSQWVSRQDLVEHLFLGREMRTAPRFWNMFQLNLHISIRRCIQMHWVHTFQIHTSASLFNALARKHQDAWNKHAWMMTCGWLWHCCYHSGLNYKSLYIILDFIIMICHFAKYFYCDIILSFQSSTCFVFQQWKILTSSTHHTHVRNPSSIVHRKKGISGFLFYIYIYKFSNILHWYYPILYSLNFSYLDLRFLPFIFWFQPTIFWFSFFCVHLQSTAMAMTQDAGTWT